MFSKCRHFNLAIFIFWLGISAAPCKTPQQFVCRAVVESSTCAGENTLRKLCYKYTNLCRRKGEPVEAAAGVKEDILKEILTIFTVKKNKRLKLSQLLNKI
jgi:hypothetical protein